MLNSAGNWPKFCVMKVIALTIFAIACAPPLLLKERSYDIFLFDYKMAGLSGVDLIRLVKEKDPSGKIFVISGRLHIEKILQKENVASLVAGVVPKPFDAAVLLDKIKAALA